MKRSRHASSSEDSDNGSNSTCWSQHSKSQPRRGKGKKPSEVFRTDLITAMKVHDSHQLNPDEYYILADPWRQDWEKGVQVPVSPQSIPHPVARVLAEKGKEVMFTKPKKLIRISRSESLGYVDIRTLAEGMCRYDLDEEDVAWIQIINEEFTEMGIPVLDEITMERVIEEFECRCHDNMTHATETEEGLGIEYDEDVVCDVCQSPDGEDNNEMVFCDKCNICVHQACYGIQKVPKGSWLCRICALGILPKCQLCPKKGGAMKPTRSGTKWVHVSCALWIPEVSIGNPEKMEPITNVSHIPSNRWALICCVCKEKRGACIQCSANNCRTAFHVTCGLSASLEMNTILTEDDEVKFKSYCPKHSGLQGSEARDSGGEEEEEKEVGDGDKKGKRRGRVREEEDDVSSSSFAPPELPSSRGPTGEPEALSSRQQEEKRGGLRKLKLQALEEEFFQFVDVEEVARRLKLSQEAVDFMYQYWKLKRKANFNQPLLTPKKDEEESLARREQEVLLRRLQLFTHLRQDLERVRNLTYMVTRREKMKRSLWRVQEQIFHHQVRLLDHELLTGDASAKDLEKIFSLGWLSNQGSQSGSPWGHSSLKTKSGSSKHEKRKGLHRKHLPYSPHTQKDSSTKPLDTKDSEGAKLKESVTVEVSGYTRDQNMDDGQGYQGFHYSKSQKAEFRDDANHVKLQKSENRAEPRREAPGPEHHKEEQEMRSRDEELALTRQKQESDNEDEEEKRRRKKRKNEPTDSTPIQTKIRLGLKPLERTVSIRLVDIRASDFDDYSINTGTASKSLMTPDPSTTITTKANKNHSAPDSIITTKPGKANVILEHCGSSTKPSGLLRKTQANTSSSHSASNGHLKNWGKFRIPKRSERPPGVAKEKQEEGAIEPASLQQQQRKPFLRPLTNTPEPSYPRTRLRTGAENEAFTPSSDAKPSDGEVEHCLKRCHSHQLRGDPSITRRYGNNIIRTGVLAS